MKKIILLGLLITTPLMADISRDTAIVYAVNRLKGQSKEIKIPVGEKALFENISITVKACYEKTQQIGTESTHWAFLQIKDLEKEATPEEALLFSGWMPSHNRNISTLEDPVYDIWIKECK
ncbi:MAG: DUF2155 domain-containing protein [Alphaproteobacteria bacterium]|nr:DUF2155 domain-containing protein [Alphaproteobacteria bacterium]MBN2779881.1 DUF2155 domain-containing protein [Alphaproteobacteria bacterium]